MKSHDRGSEKNRVKLVRCYKFKGVRTNCEKAYDVDMERIVQIVKGKLYCADWRELNDVLEGNYYFKDPKTGQEKRFFENGTTLKDQKEAYRVCSLTKNLTNPLMWAFYASEHQGVAIELRLNPNRVDVYGDPCLVEVAYDKHLPLLNLGSPELDTRKVARQILTNKIKCWKHEKEIRILNADSHYLLDESEEIATVYYGVRMPSKVLSDLKSRCGRDVVFKCISDINPDMFGSWCVWLKE